MNRKLLSLPSRAYQRRQLSNNIVKTDVCIVGGGPVGMVLASMLSNKFNRECLILEKADKLQDHPKAHYLGFRTCEILSELDPSLKEALEAQLSDCELWNSYAYTRGILNQPFARVKHFDRADLDRY